MIGAHLPPPPHPSSHPIHSGRKTRSVIYARVHDDAAKRHDERVHYVDGLERTSSEDGRRNLASAWLAIGAGSAALWLVLAIVVRIVAAPESFPWAILLAFGACCVIAATALVWRPR